MVLKTSIYSRNYIIISLINSKYLINKEQHIPLSLTSEPFSIIYKTYVRKRVDLLQWCKKFSQPPGERIAISSTKKYHQQITLLMHINIANKFDMTYLFI